MGLDEQALIERIERSFGVAAGAIIGIGDDAAVLRLGGDRAVTTDMLVEGVDFTREIPFAWVGAKALAVNLSDLAAMGAKPESFLLALGIPRDLLPRMGELIDGMAAAARRWRIALVGGDLSASRDLTISITAIGELAAGTAPLRRTGAAPGHRIFVSRPLGAATAGLQLLQRGWTIDAEGVAHPPADLPAVVGYTQREFAASVIRRQVSPDPEVELGPDLAARSAATACIDVSDGLSTDLHRLCAASGVGARIELDRVPRFPDLEAVGFSLGVNVEEAVLHGGEELALLFTSTQRESELSGLLGRPVYAIGRIVEGRGVVLESPRGESPLEPRGFDHFRGSAPS